MKLHIWHQLNETSCNVLSISHLSHQDCRITQQNVPLNTINRIAVHVFTKKILHKELICLFQEFSFKIHYTVKRNSLNDCFWCINGPTPFFYTMLTRQVQDSLGRCLRCQEGAQGSCILLGRIKIEERFVLAYNSVPSPAIDSG